ncbi:MAG: phosphoribosyltransferase [Candidatus Omnitrophica bacterium]|jgi:predicted phosphoribosyltransferase|nr:phosphoribosyltransferase [Candidatus Omnitrophota bacterium]
MGNLHIVSRVSTPFSNRIEAGKLLAENVRGIVSLKSIILGIPRGGIIIANEVAKEFCAELDIVLSRKIGAPLNPEFAIGAVSEDGNVFINEEALRQENISKNYIEREKRHQIREIQLRAKAYRAIKQKVILKGKTVVISDDGVATGATMQAAVWAIRQEKPERIILAFPVAPYDTLKRLAKEADEVVCLRVPDFFSAVGQFYADFPQVEENEVLVILSQERRQK